MRTFTNQFARSGVGALTLLSLALIACKPDAPTTDPGASNQASGADEVEDEAAAQARKAKEAAENRAALEKLPPLPGIEAPRAVELPKPVIVTLKNGLEVIVLEDREAPLVRISLEVRAGEIFAPAAKATVAGMTASLLSEGTSKRNKASIDEKVDMTGGSMSSSSSSELASIDGSFLSKDLALGLELMAEQVMQPAFPEDSITKLKDQSIQGVRAAKGNPQALAGVLAARIAYGQDSAYGRIFPTDAEIQAVTRDDVVAFHKRHYVAQNAMLVIAGDVDPKQAEALANKYFGKWTPGEQVPVPKASVTRPSKPTVHIIDRKGAQANIMVVGASPKVGEAGWLEAQVLQAVLSGGTMSTRLNFVLREQLGLTYGAYGSFDYGFDGGMFVAGGGTKNKTADQFANALIDLVYGLADAPVPDNELTRTKSFVSGRFALAAEGVGAAARLTVTARLYGLPDEFWTNYRSDVAGMDQGRLHAAAKQILDRGTLQVIAVGKADELREQLGGLGEVIVYDTDLNVKK
jgi:zinc protease